MHENRGKIAVSAIVGGVIVLAIFFVIILPLLILIQNSYAIFLDESNLRRIFDTNRISESLKVEVSQDAATRELALIVSNDGPIHVKVVRVWAIDVIRQTSITGENPCLNQELPGLPPGSNATLIVQECISGFTGIAQFLVITERGRIFSSNKVYLKNGRFTDIVFPHTLTVSIINMKKGRMYEVYVTPLGTGKVSPEKFTHKATASNENVTVAFGIFPGNYSVALYENGKLIQIPEGNPQKIEVPDATAVIFTLTYKPYSAVDLRPIINAPNTVNKKKTPQIYVEIYVQLPREADEPVEITYVGDPPISIKGAGSLVECSITAGYILYPGQIGPIGTCTIDVNNDFTITVDEGNIQGVGTIASITYKNSKGEKSVKVVAT
ncbi:MAG: hypothetical protein QXX29_01145 [Nitrososphaerota archaeon]